MADHLPLSSQSDETHGDVSSQSTISPSLKFVISNLKTLVPHQLSTDNYPIWRSQILKLLRANGFATFLESAPLSEHEQITDRNLAAAICSTISSSVLPYIIHLDLTLEIWKVLETRFQSSCRSKVIQLKNELHNFSMKTISMTQYLTEIKKIVDQIASTGCIVGAEDIILYIVNGLPPLYQPFKTSIRTMLTSISLDNLYALLISEEIHLQNEAAHLPTPADPNMALYTRRGRGRRNSADNLKIQILTFALLNKILFLAKYATNVDIRLMSAGTD
ncbi:uncharacterized protein LOC110104283 [Dendrobium catenatum]|uniref:uncharacterized protein LOC110104283 n=1 Tax=Dendrobium catenatum TaxID=906689 RepID=UPI0009F55871|nr:uncharacterized protein LOC110104283 [Dendrobium catenatum]